jgi:hypothetical protein
LFRENEQGRIYGATFIDNEQKCVFNGSRLGKEFSANVFNDLFKNDNSKDDNIDFRATKREFCRTPHHKNNNILQIKARRKLKVPLKKK